MWKVEVVSHESIKPSSPTPPHHSTHRLSWLDRMSPPDPFTFIFFYSGDVVESLDKTLPILKNSLSRTLTLFYPLAGRLNPKDVSVVDCNDQGVDLFEARAASDAPLSRLLDRCAVRDQLIQFQPPASTGSSSSPPPLLSIQITTFVACGSMAIAASFSHALVDAHSAAEFIAAWSDAASRGDNSPRATRRPIFDTALRFGPPSEGNSAMQDAARRLLGAQSGKKVAKRFVFEEPAIDALRKTAPAPAPAPPTRVVALAALLWRCCVRVRMRRLAASAGNTRFATVALFPVNMRGKAPLPDHLFGNLCDLVAVAAPSETIGDGENVGHAKLSSEEKLRSGIRRTDGEWVRRLQGEEKLSAVLKSLGEVKREAGEYGGGGDGGKALIYSFTSWSRFPLYEADFGWGKPSLVAPGTMVQVGDGVVVMGRGVAGGMEAWVNLGEEEMLEFERDEELMSYASPLPSAPAPASASASAQPQPQPHSMDSCVSSYLGLSLHT